VGLTASGESDESAVMKVVVPEGVESAAAALGRPHQMRILLLILGDDEGAAAPRRLAHAFPDRRHDVLFRSVENLLGRVQTQAVEMKLVDPVTGIGDEELAHRGAVGAVEVESLAPLILVAGGEVVGGKARQIISIRADVVVDDVENDAEAGRVSLVHKAAKII